MVGAMAPCGQAQRPRRRVDGKQSSELDLNTARQLRCSYWHLFCHRHQMRLVVAAVVTLAQFTPLLTIIEEGAMVCPVCRGISVQFAVELVSNLPRNTDSMRWPAS